MGQGIRNTRFVVAGTQRTGTTLICSTLDKHPEICSLGEVFLFRKGRGSRVEGSYRQYLNQDLLRRYFRHFVSRRAMVYEYLDQLKCYGAGRRAIGFKLMLGQVRRFPCAADYIRANNLRIIQVSRRNALKTLVSRVALSERRIAHSTEQVKPEKIVIPVAGLAVSLEEIVAESRWAETAFPDARILAVWYEDYVSNKTQQLDAILGFLEISATDGLESALVKVNPDRLSDVIENYDDVISALRGTTYEDFLDQTT